MIWKKITEMVGAQRSLHRTSDTALNTLTVLTADDCDEHSAGTDIDDLPLSDEVSVAFIPEVR